MLLLRKKPVASPVCEPDRAPTGTPCVECGAKQLGVPQRMLTHCSVCPGWRCVGACFSMHKAPAAFYAETGQKPWWMRVIGRG